MRTEVLFVFASGVQKLMMPLCQKTPNVLVTFHDAFILRLLYYAGVAVSLQDL